MAEIILKEVKMQFGKETIISNLNLNIKDGSFTVLIGPSGCGKSTTLRIIAGLEKQTEGEVWIDGQMMNHVLPGKRDVAMVFQNYALYPTMTVKENIEFGLKNRKVPYKERQALIEEIAEIVSLTDYLNRKPSTLSGGQRQRVALARAMVKKPKVFLMDEPLSNLDAKLRNQMRTELIQLHKRLGTTFLYVTHDQLEAMSMGSEIVIMKEGVIQQAASPLDIYHHPANQFTAQFIGTPPMNIIDRRLVFKDSTHQSGKLGFRPEKVKLTNIKKKDGVSIPGTIKTRETLGSETIYQIQSDLGTIMVKSFDQPLEEDIRIMMFIPFKDLYFFDVNGNRMDHVLESEQKIFVGGI